MRVDLRAGDTLVVPPGWVAAAATTAPAISVAGNFLLRDSLAVHLEAWRIEVCWACWAWGRAGGQRGARAPPGECGWRLRAGSARCAQPRDAILRVARREQTGRAGWFVRGSMSTKQVHRGRQLTAVPPF